MNFSGPFLGHMVISNLKLLEYDKNNNMMRIYDVDCFGRFV